MRSPDSKTLSPRPVAIIGPTGAGKSAASLAVARALEGEVINIDSMQLYRGMDIGTAKLTKAERGTVSHHLLDIWDVDQPASVAEYATAAVATVEDIASRNKKAIIVGGSMMYIQSLIDQWKFPPTDPDVRAKWEAELRRIGVEALHAHLATVDPEAARIIETKDPRRTVRALEVIELTGKPFAASQPPKDRPTRWGTTLIGLHAPAEWLNPRLEQRVNSMFDNGLVEEVQRLKHLGLTRTTTAGQAIGYAQVLDYLDGQLSLEEAKEQTIIGTRRYARRQRSWFRRDHRIHWVDASAEDMLTQVVELASQ
ncbi:tRNA (adenosine(37)-N6)-dimethylallyltransferase MiaA [Corynebacterium anserum]|uniref:tRNA dimethylallyltransferase n=1 Tax=Corynebacterium anserum TaxID=2684406 RepID=A0A7G7YNQ2_9CORY|nr:tRNA (adenosine(37)-N6)-dimethylallyltransferase MiaA [Corynebacterium anserum]MBC2681709.1 tRNA (adenosine(37)-N6)-dimethylallyltransferase MiaA [Corynebacterium anserum]QNH96122.1 tRNA (adenosine(37)-N6)-dimethylallyltransferase MiaA [Corynebacterium anserum]